MQMFRRLLLITLVTLCGCANQYIEPTSPAIASGLQPGEDIVPWNPIHVAGPDKGTNACPICTYEARPAVQIFIKDGPNLPAIATRLEKLVDQQKKREFKGFIIVLDSTPDRLKQMATDLKIENIGLCYPASETRAADLKTYKINPAADNTIVLYNNYKVIANYVNLDAADFDHVVAAVNKLP